MEGMSEKGIGEEIKKRRGNHFRKSQEQDGEPAAYDGHIMRGQVEAFTVYNCSNRSNIIESYSLLEPDACATWEKAGEGETTMYGEIVQIK
jgi:hypothetical protein